MRIINRMSKSRLQGSPARSSCSTRTVPLTRDSVRPHPVYQGPFDLISNVGSINIHTPSSPIPDPLGRGRDRHFEIERQKGMFPKVVDGKVVWSGGRDNKGHKDEVGKMDAKTSSGSINVEF